VADRIILRIPWRCVLCESIDSVTLQHVVKGSDAILTWYCEVCQCDWPIILADLSVPERRHAVPDRRRMTRGDRRKPH